MARVTTPAKPRGSRFPEVHQFHQIITEQGLAVSVPRRYSASGGIASTGNSTAKRPRIEHGLQPHERTFTLVRTPWIGDRVPAVAISFVLGAEVLFPRELLSKTLPIGPMIVRLSIRDCRSSTFRQSSPDKCNRFRVTITRLFRQSLR